MGAPGLSVSCWLLPRETMSWGEKWIQLILMPTTHPSGWSGDFWKGGGKLEGTVALSGESPIWGGGGTCTSFGHLCNPCLLQLSV